MGCRGRIEVASCSALAASERVERLALHDPEDERDASVYLSPGLVRVVQDQLGLNHVDQSVEAQSRFPRLRVEHPAGFLSTHGHGRTLRLLAALVLAAALLALVPAAASARPTHCFLSAANARNIAARYEAHAQAAGAFASYTVGSVERRRSPRTLVVWVREDSVQMLGGEDGWIWNHPLHVTVHGSRAHVALEGFDSDPFSVHFRCG
jgi:hypothetical protein